MMNKNDNFLIYKSNDGKVSVNVRMQDETVWLTQKQLAELFDTSRENVTMHIQGIFSDNELDENSVSKKILLTAGDGKKYNTNHYDLDMIISLGYRINSKVATKFRQWATGRLREYIVKGFTLDDERLKQGGGRYFKELLQRIRDIRTSERNLYQQVTDIYATSIDYDPSDEMTKQFFATVQNKMHYAVHGNTAAEVIYDRANAKKLNMGLTSFKGAYLTVDDTKIAKNYLHEEELNILNLIVSQYLDFAELQAARQKAMTMARWIAKLDDYLRVNESKILTDAGKVSHKRALEKAKKEYDVYRAAEMKKLESDFDKATKKLRNKAGEA